GRPSPDHATTQSHHRTLLWHNKTFLGLRLLPLPRNAPCHDRSDFNRAGLQFKASLQPDRSQEPDRCSELGSHSRECLAPRRAGLRAQLGAGRVKILRLAFQVTTVSQQKNIPFLSLLPLRPQLVNFFPDLSHSLALQRTRRERRGCNRRVPCAGSLSLGR